MGGSSSKPAPKPAANKAAAPPPPVNTISVCAVRRVELNQLSRDVTLKQTEVDTCDPVAAQARRTQEAIKENQTYVTQKRAELEKALGDFNTQKLIASKIANATEPLRQYEHALGSEVISMDAKKRKLESAERTSRRDFLDNDPQSGVDGFLGIRTSDDKILLIFWICYFIAIGLITAIILTLFETQIGLKKKLSIVGVVLVGAWAAAYTCITKFA